MKADIPLAILSIVLALASAHFAFASYPTHTLTPITLCVQIARPDADINHDGVVDIVDLSIVAAAFGSRPGDTNWNPSADLNKDGRIDIVDFAIVGAYFGGTTCLR